MYMYFALFQETPFPKMNWKREFVSFIFIKMKIIIFLYTYFFFWSIDHNQYNYTDEDRGENNIIHRQKTKNSGCLLCEDDWRQKVHKDGKR